MASITLPKHFLHSLYFPLKNPKPHLIKTSIYSPNLLSSNFMASSSLIQVLSQCHLHILSKFPFLLFFSLQVGKGLVPPPFTLKDQDGKNVSLSKFKGKPVVVYFYPADETPGCTKQALVVYQQKVSFRDSYEKFKKAEAQVVVISGDDPSSHKAFMKKHGLPFTLLSDEGNKVRKEWGVPADLFGTLPGRQTYVLDNSNLNPT